MNRCTRLLAGTLAFVSACIAQVGFDPVGEAASVEGSWTIGGEPPRPERCADRAIRFVRVRFFDGSQHRDHPGLVFDCGAGAFDTRPTRLVAPGSWAIRLVAIRDDGSEVESGPEVVYDTTTGHIELATVHLAGGSG